MTMTSMPAGQQEEATTGGRSRRMLVIIVVVLLAALAGTYQFVIKPNGDDKPVPGAVLALDAVQINLAGGHYLRLGLALQTTKDAKEIEGSKALDAAIELFTGRRVGEMTDPRERRRLKKQLSAQVHELYDEQVLEVYFTDFVTQ